MGGQTEPGGPSAGRRWTGRGYVHVVVPVGFLTAHVARAFDDAVGAADGWSPVAGAATVPVLRRVWRRDGGPARPDRADGGEVRLTVLGWYPLLVTVAAADRAGRRALRRVTAAALTMDGKLVTDRDLSRRVAAARDRGGAAGRLHAAAAGHRAEAASRACDRCGRTTGFQATHCDRCGRRFTAVDDAGRAARYDAAVRGLAEVTAELDRLASDRPMRATEVA